jgi:uncharacterized protein
MSFSLGHAMLTTFARRCSSIALCGMLALTQVACGGGSDDGSDPPPDPRVDPPVATLPDCPSVAEPVTAISAVQGSSDTSPLLGQTVTVRGVVVGDFQATNQLNGFFVQQVSPDADPATAEGLFVFAPAGREVAVGDYVQVQGVVAEFGASSTGGVDSSTQIANPSRIDVCGPTTLPEAVEVALPAADARALERYEGMRVRFAQTLTVVDNSELGRFGQLVLATTRQTTATNAPGGVDAAAQALARIVLDDGATTSNPNPMPHLSASDTSGTRRAGDTVAGVAGVLTESFGAYRVHPTAAPSFVASNARPSAPPAVAGALKVASLNVLNYFTSLGGRGANNAIEFARQKDKIVAAISAIDADVIGLMEIENNADTAVADLVAGGHPVQARQSQKGRQPGAAHRPDVGRLHRAERPPTAGATFRDSASG